MENAEKFFKEKKNRGVAEKQKEIGVVKMYYIYMCVCACVCACMHVYIYISGFLFSRKVVRSNNMFTQSATVAAV